MKITIISLIEDVGCINLRYLSSYIRSHGHTTQLIFLPRLYSEGWSSDESYKYPLRLETIQQIKYLCSSSDIIAISLMSCHFDNAVYLTNKLKTINKPIIWGGIHPTISPIECLDYADMVNVGEAEISLTELLNKMENNWCEQTSCHCDYLAIRSKSKCKDCPYNINIDGILTDKTQPITIGKRIEDLNDLPFPDYDFDHQYVLYENEIVKLNKTILSNCFNGRYRTSFSRGCTSSCAYCCNNVFKRLYGNTPIRWRSIPNQIAELKWAKYNIPNITRIEFSDDTFLSRSKNEIYYFAERYREEINLPFVILSTPTAVSYDKLKALTYTGLINIGIGIQTVHEHCRLLYKRKESVDQIIKASKIINQVSRDSLNPLTARYDFITDNPWGGEKETEENIKFALTLPKPRQIRIFSLVFYHGTELHEKAMSEHLIKNELNDVYRVTQLTPKNTYMNNVFSLLSLGVPDSIIKLLLNKYIRQSKLVSILNTILKYNNSRKFVHKTSYHPRHFNGNAGEIINSNKS